MTVPRRGRFLLAAPVSLALGGGSLAGWAMEERARPGPEAWRAKAACLPERAHTGGELLRCFQGTSTYLKSALPRRLVMPPAHAMAFEQLRAEGSFQEDGSLDYLRLGELIKSFSAQADLPELADVWPFHLLDPEDGLQDTGVDQDHLLEIMVQQPAVNTAMVGTREGWHCSGARIAPGVVLTARHCLKEELRVGFGLHTAAPFRTLRVLDTAVPEDPSMDVALLKLSGDIDAVGPVSWYLGDEEQPERKLMMYGGFGSEDEDGLLRGKRITLGADTIDSWDCTSADARRHGCSPENELLVAFPGVVDTCAGDSGGPLYEALVQENAGAPNPKGPKLTPEQRVARVLEWRLVGVTSRGGAGSRKACGSGGIYTRTEILDPWIRETLITWR